MRDIFDLDDDELLRIAQDDWTRSDQHYSTLFNDMQDDIKRFWLINDGATVSVGEQESDDPSERSNIKLSYARARIETSVSLIISALFSGGDKWLQARFLHDLLENDQPKRQLLTEIFRQHRLNQLGYDKMNFIDKMEGFILQSALTYWSVGYVGWHRAGGYVRKAKKPLSKETGKINAEISEALDYLKMKKIETSAESRSSYDPKRNYEYVVDKENYPCFHILNTFNTRPDPLGGRNFDSCSYFMDELRVSWEELRTNEYNKKNPNGFYTNLDRLLEITKDSGVKTGEEKMRENIGSVNAGRPTMQDETRKKSSFRDSVVCRRYWTSNGYFVTDDNFKVVIRKQPTDGWILFKDTWSYDTKFDAQSAARLLRNHDEAINSTMNLRLDAESWAIEGVRLIDGMRVSEDDRGKPLSAGVEITTMGSPKDIYMSDRAPEVGQSSIQDIQLIRKDGDELLHINENTMGQYFQFSRKATEVQKVDQQQANHLGQRVERTERTIVTPIMNMITKIEPLYISNEEKLSWFDPKLGHNRVEALDPDLLDLYSESIYYEAVGSRWVNEMERRRSGILNAFNSTMANPVTAQISNPVTIHQLVWKEVGGMLDPQDLLADNAQDRLSYDPEHEWILMKLGVSLDPHRMDDNEYHKKIHERQLISGQASDINPEALKLLQEHIDKTDQAIAASQTINPMGQMQGMAQPGQEISSNTPGTQAANLGNVQPKGLSPANAGVAQEMMK